MKNFVQYGLDLTVTAPYDVASGAGMQVGANLFGVAHGAYDNGDTEAVIRTAGVFDLTALSTATASPGAKAYWDNTNKHVTATASTHLCIGTFQVAKTNGQTVARVAVGTLFEAEPA